MLLKGCLFISNVVYGQKHFARLVEIIIYKIDLHLTLYQRRRKQLGENIQWKFGCNTSSVTQYFTWLLCVVTVCSCSSAEAELKMEIHFTSASLSSFACLLINSELLLAAQTLTSRECFISWVVVINHFGSIFEV